MTSKIDWQLALAFAAGIIILWLVNDNHNKQRKIAELKSALKANNILSSELKDKLQELISTHPDLDENIKSELTQIAALLEINQETKAILSLAKIIESLLKRLYKEDVDFKTYLASVNIKRPSFHHYLDYASKIGIVPQEEYHLLKLLKIIRNQEAHELDVRKEKGKIVACFVSGISFTIGLYRRIKAAS